MIERVDFSCLQPPANDFSKEAKKKVSRADIKLVDKREEKPTGKELYILQVHKVFRQ